MWRSTPPGSTHGSGAPLEPRARAAGLAAASYLERGLAWRLRGVGTPRGPAFRAASARPHQPVVSDDFSGLVLAPFGTAFKDISVPLTEVLVFHQADEAGARATTETAFGRTLWSRFSGRAPTDHLLCFDHDRLQKIEAAVAVPAAEAPALFAAACADWQRGAAAAAQGPEACEGRQQDIAFSARRTEGPDPDAATVSITLVAVSAP